MKAGDKAVDKAGDRKQRKHGEVTVYWNARRGGWYYRAQIDRRDVQRSTGVAQHNGAGRAMALKKAKEIAEALRRGDQVALDEVSRRPGFGTVGELLEAWTVTGPIKSADAVASRFRRYVRESFKTDAWEKVGLAEALDADRFRAWVQEQARMGRSEAGIRSDVASIRSVVAPGVAAGYRNFKLPPVEKFRAVSLSTRRREGSGAVKAKPFVAIPQEELQRMERVAERLRRSGKESLRRVWAVFALMRWCGLRNTETVALRWSWVRQGKHGPLLDFITRELPKGGKYYPKGRDGSVPVRQELLDQMREAFPESEEFVIPRTSPTDAENLCLRAINRFVGRYLKSRRGKKVSYNLRGQYGSEIAMRDGIEVASRNLRHATLQTTWAHYQDAVSEPKPL